MLGEIDARPYETQLAQVEGQRVENQARLKNAKTDLERFEKLSAEELITGQQVTSQEALVGQIVGALQTNEAQVNNARLNLAYTKIIAPIGGRLGLRQVDPGNLVRSGDANGIVVITQMSPISVIFTVPESDLPSVLEPLRAGSRLPVEAWDRADTTKLAVGTLQTVDNQIDTTTGTIKLRASFDNGDQKLFPNQFVNVRLRVKTLPNATVIPAAAIQRASFGTFVYVVKPDSTVSIQRIAVGSHRERSGRGHVRSGAAGAGRARRRRCAHRRRARRDRARGWREAAAPSGGAGRPGRSGGARRPSARAGPGPMNISRTFILRPVATALLMAALLLSGMLAYRLLPVSALPQVDYPTIRVLTFYPGASPEVMTSAVTAPLERQFGQMPGLSQMSSTSSGGASVITLRFTLEKPLDVAEQEVQAAMNAANSLLPNDLPQPPVYNKVNPADTPVLTLAVTSKTVPLPQVHDLVDTRVAQKLSQLPGVGLVSIAGGQRPAVRIQANPQALAAHGLNLQNLRSVIAAANVNQPKGNFDGPERSFMLDANDQLRSPEAYRKLIVA